MGCDDPSFVPISPLVGELWHFQYIRTWQPSAILYFKFFYIDHVTVIVVLTCCCVPNFIKIGSRVRPTDSHIFWMLNVPCRCQATAVAMATASWWTCGGHDGMRPHKFHPNRSIDRRVITFPTFCNMAAIRHYVEFEFCYSRPPTKSTVWFDYPVKIWCRSDLPRRRYCNFIILPVWLENT